MTCQTVLSLLSDYRDDELNQEMRSEVEKHLDDCEACTQELEDICKMIDIIKRFQEKEPHRDYLYFIDQE